MENRYSDLGSFHAVAGYATWRAGTLLDLSGTVDRWSPARETSHRGTATSRPLTNTPFQRPLGGSRLFTASGVTQSNYYDTLGVRPGSSPVEIKKAYRREAMKWHPDRHPDGAAKAKAEIKFKHISEAYQALSSGRGGEGYSGGGSNNSGSRSGYTNSKSSSSQSQSGAYRRDSAGNTWAHSGTDYSRSDADKVFREMFGDNPFVRDFVKEFTRSSSGNRSGNGFPGGFARGSFGGPMGGVNGRPTMTPEQWAELAKGVFGAMGSANAAGGVNVQVHEEIVTRSDGRRVVRKTTTTTSRHGSSRKVEERVVGVGGPYDYYANQKGAGQPHSSRVFAKGWGGTSYNSSGGSNARPPPPPGGNSELAVVLGRLGQIAGTVARGFLARFAQMFTRQILTMGLRLLLRIVFRR